MSVCGCLLGTAVGDSIGLPYEGLSRNRGRRLFGPADRHRFFWGRGLISDDTEHACMVAQSLIDSGGDLNQFRKQLARRFRWWLVGIPAGIGLATLRAIVKLWLGFNLQRSGVFSAGNGPAMRAAVLGAAIADRVHLREFVRASSRITHTDPKAEYGAFTVALAANLLRTTGTCSADQFLHELRSSLESQAEELIRLIEQVVASVNQGESTQTFAESLGLMRGVSGYVYHTVPVAIHAWLTNPNDLRNAITTVIHCGGDTDSTAAIVGGIVGTAVGKPGIPVEWLDGLVEWPRSVVWIERLGALLDAGIEIPASERSTVRAPTVPTWGLVCRNLLFIVIVLYHGFRRLFPPYGARSK